MLTPAEFRERSRSFWLFGTGAGAALFAGALLGVIVGTVIVAQTLYSSTKDHLNEFATLRAIGSSRRYIYKVIVCQALLSAVIGFCYRCAHRRRHRALTAATALPIVITPGLIVGLFLLTVVMCVGSAIAAIVQGDAHRSGHGVHAMTEFVIEAVDIAKVLGSGAAQVRALKGVRPVAPRRGTDSADGAVRQRQDHAALHSRLHADADGRNRSRPRRSIEGKDPRTWPSSGGSMWALSFNPIICFRR